MISRAMVSRLSMLLVLTAAFFWQSSSGKADDLLKPLRPKHPRLYVLDDEIAAVKKELDKEPMQGWYKGLQDEAKKMLKEPPAEHKLADTIRMLNQSQAALHRIITLAGLYRLDGDREKAERARKEMLAAAAFPDWNTSHFLDTAEMTNALAIGYDWLFDYLSEEDRQTIRAAIVEKGLKPGLEAQRKKVWWSRTTNNWSQVCGGGLAAGALAIAEDEPELAREILTNARKSLEISMRSFAPDGGCEEGPGYWKYATRYNVFFLSATQSALGTDFDLKKMPGFAATGNFRLHSEGPLKQTFNFADATSPAGSAPQMFWLAREFNQPLFTHHELGKIGTRPHILHLLWFTGRNADKEVRELPKDALFHGVNVAFFRSAWQDPKATYVGFKGGDNKASHAHLDLGTFVLDGLGQRWALDLGPDDYNLPGYFGKQRWTYYRLRTEGHNTLTIDGDNQIRTAKAPIIAFLSTEQRAFAVTDLSQAYKPKIKSAHRGVAVLNRRQILIQDEVQPAQAVEIAWNFHTDAKIDLDGAKATLTKGGAKMTAKILSPEGARFETVAANPPLPQRQNPTVNKLVIHLKTAKETRIAILLEPADDKMTVPAIEPLEKWIDAGRLEKRNPNRD